MNQTSLNVPLDLKKTTLQVLAWTDHFFGEEYLDSVHVDNPRGDDITLHFTHDRGAIADVDAIWFHGPSIHDMPTTAKTCPRILMSMESEANYPALVSPYAKVAFDIFMTYRLDADVPCIYPNWDHYNG
ncbi:MAG: hypothetical protein AAF420_10565, partial [Pseudomonadota bacterium]